jgi:signal transduction histidine kinase
MQAMPDGGELHIKVETTLREDNKLPLILLCVSDQGQGIDVAKKDQLFKPFYTTRAEGTGLGLAIVKRIADENGWQLDIRNRPAGGTEFSIRIPAENL